MVHEKYHKISMLNLDFWWKETKKNTIVFFKLGYEALRIQNVSKINQTRKTSSVM